MPRLALTFRTVIDLAVLSLALWLAYLFRFEFQIPSFVLGRMWVYWPSVIAVQYAALVAFGVTRMSWRYLNMRDAVHAFIALAVPTALLVALRFTRVWPLASRGVIPYGVLAMDFVLTFMGVVGVRASRRMWGEVQERKKRTPDGQRERVLLIGAGEAGVIVARELAHRPDLGLQPVGFLDDDPLKRGTMIAGVSVLGASKDVAPIAQLKRVKRALITIANASGHQIRRITELCRDAGLKTTIIPGIYEIVGGKVNLSRLREVAIEDLLRRDPVRLDEDVVSASIRSRVVLVTGAGGSIGSELCRQICRFGPERLVLVERYENALFEIHRELAAAFPHVPIEPRICDICDADRVRAIMSATRPEIVFHAAAHKHVPMMEWNPGEAIKNNVGGTRALALIAHEMGVQRFVLVSTDKAVNPTSVMGATKRVAEIFIQALSQTSSTRFVAVRFGNVLGSAGSVVPIFREQIARGGPVMVTHPEMCRYFMTIPEASQLVLQAGAMGSGGEIFILDMGDPVKIVELARDLITLSGLRLGEDIEIAFSGIRPGEKLYEELSTTAESARPTTHPKVLTGRIDHHDFSSVETKLQRLMEIARTGNNEDIRVALGDLVPGYVMTRSNASTEAEIGGPLVQESGPAEDHPLRN